MTVQERDPFTGHMTTGHEWNGIKELNTPVPRAVYFFLIVMVAISVVSWILMPAWPLGVTYTKGLLGLNDRAELRASLTEAMQDRTSWAQQIEAKSFKDIAADPRLMTIVRQSGHTLFGDNCAACHGFDAKGGPGFPNLTTTSWLWGGDPEAIAETIRVGINSAHPDSRVSQMPAFGHDQMLPAADIENVATYVQSLSNPVAARDAKPGQIEAGKTVFEANCTSCHGDDAKGKTDTGAPNLTDRSWIYGGSKQAILTTLWNGRQGHMPTWDSRLSPLDRKILALYLYDRRSAEP